MAEPLLIAKSGNAELLKKMREKHSPNLPTTEADLENARAIIKSAQDPKARAAQNREKLGMIVELGLLEKLQAVDDNTRSSFMPYGISGVIIGAALVFFAFIGFDSISTHSEEAINPQRDLPIGIISSLVLCSVLYVGVSAVITGMVPYPDIDHGAAIASAFGDEGIRTNSTLLKLSAALIAIGGLAGMTSVLLITFLSQARIFLAMARDGLLPHSVFGVVHPKFRTPHVSTMLTGGIIALVAGFTPILRLEEMVNIGTLFAFVVVCAAVLILRIKRPEAHRPFRCPLVYIVAPMGIAVNVLLMLFLPLHTWERLAYWLLLGLVFYFSFGFWNSTMANRLSKVVGSPETGIASGAPPRA